MKSRLRRKITLRASILTLIFALSSQINTASAIKNGEDDVNTLAANAVVNINDCTGSLVAKDLVVTAGHCLESPFRETPEDSGLNCSDREVSGRWYRLQRIVTVKFGNDIRTPVFETTATEYNMPGCADVFMVRLRTPVPSTVATPVKVLASIGTKAGAEDSPFFRGKRLTMVGWGEDETGSIPRIRQRATGRYVSHTNEKMHIRGNGRAITDSGDSGGPIFWDHPTTGRYLVGVLQGPTPARNHNRYTPTFRHTVNRKPDVGKWFNRVVPSAIHCDAGNNPPPGAIPLVSWWSDSRRDNWMTSDPRWAGCRGARRGPDYRFTRNEGYIFNPALPQPVGTVRLESWYDSRRGDNFATSHPRWIHWWNDGRRRNPNYKYVRLEGYIFSPDRTQPTGTIPIYRWYNRGRGDNWTTTNHADRGVSGLPVSSGYGRPRLIGYVYPAN